jgi:hypothetical protein
MKLVFIEEIAIGHIQEEYSNRVISRLISEWKRSVLETPFKATRAEFILNQYLKYTCERLHASYREGVLIFYSRRKGS